MWFIYQASEAAAFKRKNVLFPFSAVSQFIFLLFRARRKKSFSTRGETCKSIGNYTRCMCFVEWKWTRKRKTNSEATRNLSHTAIIKTIIIAAAPQKVINYFISLFLSILKWERERASHVWVAGKNTPCTSHNISPARGVSRGQSRVAKNFLLCFLLCGAVC